MSVSFWRQEAATLDKLKGSWFRSMEHCWRSASYFVRLFICFLKDLAQLGLLAVLSESFPNAIQYFLAPVVTVQFS